MSRSGAAGETRPVIPVACAVLQRASGEVLLAQRPAGKIAAGWWEFPGGKIEAGEPPLAALARELHEELGVGLRAARRLIRYRHAYRDRIVVLDTWLVTGFEPEPYGRERQALAWVPPERVCDYKILPTVEPSLAPLRFPVDYVFTPPEAGEAAIRAGLPQLPRGALLRLRLPGLDEDAYAALAERVREAVQAQGLRLVLDRDPALTRRLAAWAHHAPVAQWQAWAHPPGLRLIGSAHSRAEVERLRALGAAAAVAGHVLDTPSHAGERPLGWEGFEAIAFEAGIPVYAIGGVGPAQQAEVFHRGGQGTAGIGAYWSRGASGGLGSPSPSGSCSIAGMP